MADASGGRPRRVRVLVLASDPDTANRVRCQLEEHSSIEVIGVVHSADAAVVACARRRVDVVVTVSEAQAARTRLLQRAISIRTRYPATRVVVALHSKQRLWDTLLARPDGLLAATAPSQEVHEVVGGAAAGHVTIGQSVRDAFFNACALTGEQPDAALEDLTPRQTEIISAGARGLTSREIADHLHIAVNTVDKALTVIYRKLGARNRAEACLIAARRGLVR